MKKFILIAVALMLLSAPMALAAITPNFNPTPIQQTFDNPCVIGDPSCNNPTGGNGPWFSWNAQSGPGAGNVYDFTSPAYLVGASLIAASDTKTGGTPISTIPSSFDVGIDENLGTGQGPEVLQFFKTFVSTDSGASWTLLGANSYVPAGGVNLPDNHNGNGFSDMLLMGFSLTPGTWVRFEASVTNDTDGMEEFFIITNPTSTLPEPMTLLLLGFGLVGLAGVSRFRK